MTESYYTKGEDFKIADAVFDCIGEAGDERFRLSDLTTPGAFWSAPAAARRACAAHGLAEAAGLVCGLYATLALCGL